VTDHRKLLKKSRPALSYYDNMAVRYVRISIPDRELLDTAALCGHLVPAGSVYALLAEHRKKIFPDELFVDLFESERGVRRSRRT
jgi:hypothetical protein